MDNAVFWKTLSPAFHSKVLIFKCTVMFQGRAEVDSRRSNSKPAGVCIVQFLPPFL
jgi:hypothetical protein